MDLTKNVVVKANKIIEASYKLSLSEQRVLLACISKIDSTKELTADTQFEISASEVFNLSDLDDMDTAYLTLQIASKQLFDREVLINTPDPNNPRINKRRTRWISVIDYIDTEAKVILCFSPGIIPFLSQLSREFTKYKLEHVSRFDSMYSIRLYELLAQWLSTGKRDIEVEWLKSHFQVEEKYPRVTDLQKRVIDVAVTDINEHSNLLVKYTKRKAGRVITHFLFTFGLKEPKKPSINKTKTRPPAPDYTPEQKAAHLADMQAQIEQKGLKQSAPVLTGNQKDAALEELHKIRE